MAGAPDLKVVAPALPKPPQTYTKTIQTSLTIFYGCILIV